MCVVYAFVVHGRASCWSIARRFTFSGWEELFYGCLDESIVYMLWWIFDALLHVFCCYFDFFVDVWDAGILEHIINWVCVAETINQADFGRSNMPATHMWNMWKLHNACARCECIHIALIHIALIKLCGNVSICICIQIYIVFFLLTLQFNLFYLQNSMAPPFYVGCVATRRPVSIMAFTHAKAAR